MFLMGPVGTDRVYRDSCAELDSIDEQKEI